MCLASALWTELYILLSFEALHSLDVFYMYFIISHIPSCKVVCQREEELTLVEFDLFLMMCSRCRDEQVLLN